MHPLPSSILLLGNGPSGVIGGPGIAEAGGQNVAEFAGPAEGKRSSFPDVPVCAPAGKGIRTQNQERFADLLIDLQAGLLRICGARIAIKSPAAVGDKRSRR